MKFPETVKGIRPMTDFEKTYQNYNPRQTALDEARALLRSGADDAQLLAAIRETIWSKPREHHFEDRCMPATRSMYRIGG